MQGILGRMRPLLTSLIAGSVLILAVSHGLSESSPLKIVKLVPPVYPPIAMAARVTGDVHLQVTLHEDGTIGWVQVQSGPQMLRDSAAESARKSLYSLEQLDRGSSYELVYRFDLDPTECGEGRDSSYPHVSENLNLVTVTEKASVLCDPAADVRVRSAKCLFLWRCAWRTP
jgi:TonB family protein